MEIQNILNPSPNPNDVSGVSHGADGSQPGRFQSKVPSYANGCVRKAQEAIDIEQRR